MRVGKLRGIYKACEERNRQVVKLITILPKVSERKK